MESSERRSFGSRQGEKSDAVQAPLAFRDDVRGPKNQVQAIAEKTSFSWFYLTAGGVFSALTSSKSSTDATASLCGLLLVRCEKFIHSDCFQLNKTRSSANPRGGLEIMQGERMTFRSRLSGLAGIALALAVTGAGTAFAGERTPLPEGAYQVAQVTDPQVYALQEELRNLNGRIEELSFQLLEMQEQMRRMQEDNEFRFQQLEGTGGTDNGGSTDSEMLQDSGDAGNALPEQNDSASADTSAPAAGSQTLTMGSSEDRGAPPRDLGSLTIDGSGNIVGGDVDFSQQSIENAVDGEVVASVVTTDDPEEYYRQGYAHVLNGDYRLAEGIFRSFIDAFPNDSLVPDARFWIADSMRGQGRLEEAADMFIAIRHDYPESQKAPETLLKIGQIMAALGDRDVACVTFDDAVTSYPAMSESVRMRIREERMKAKC
jgi:tol-pal system protein YbgF